MCFLRASKACEKPNSLALILGGSFQHQYHSFRPVLVTDWGPIQPPIHQEYCPPTCTLGVFMGW